MPTNTGIDTVFLLIVIIGSFINIFVLRGSFGLWRQYKTSLFLLIFLQSTLNIIIVLNCFCVRRACLIFNAVVHGNSSVESDCSTKSFENAGEYLSFVQFGIILLLTANRLALEFKSPPKIWRRFIPAIVPVILAISGLFSYIQSQTPGMNVIVCALTASFGTVFSIATFIVIRRKKRDIPENFFKRKLVLFAFTFIQTVLLFPYVTFLFLSQFGNHFGLHSETTYVLQGITSFFPDVLGILPAIQLICTYKPLRKQLENEERHATTS